MSWIWIVLLWMVMGNNCCSNACQCENSMPTPQPMNNQPNQGYGCGPQPRQFNGFGGGNTCGCEEKE